MVKEVVMYVKRKVWNKEEDQTLKDLIKAEGRNWARIGEIMNKKSHQCAQRWKRLRPIDQKIKNAFTLAEDELIVQQYAILGPQWGRIASFLKKRHCKQIRERFINHLDPTLVKTAWTEEEDTFILDNIKQMGTKWSVISKMMKGRSENMIKNRYYAVLKKRQIKVKEEHSDQNKIEEPEPISVPPTEIKPTLEVKQEEDVKVKEESIEVRNPYMVQNPNPLRQMPINYPYPMCHQAYIPAYGFVIFMPNRIQ